MIKWLSFLVMAYVAVVLAMTLLQRKLMYVPHQDMQSPAEYGLKEFTPGTLRTKDQLEIAYWYAPPKKDAPTILYLHGNAGHLGHRVEFYHQAAARGYGVMALSYRGFGRSQGVPSEQGLYADAYAAIAALNDKYRTPNQRIIVYGESIGTGVAMEVARNNTFKAVVLQAPFTSALARAEEIYFWLPVRWMLWDIYDSLGKAGEVTSPVLVLVGEADTLIPPADSKVLFDAISTRKKFVSFPMIGHNNFEPTATLDALSDFDSNER